MLLQKAAVAGLVLALCATVYGATVTYDVVFTGNEAQRDATFAPGAGVNITVTARVDPADAAAPDTDGLALVNLDLGFTFGIAQESLTLDDGFASVFALFASGGTPSGTNVISEIGGSQGFSESQIVHGKGLGAPMTIATGTLQAPTTAGTYTIQTYGKGTNVFRPSPSTGVFSAGTIVNSSLTVRISSGGGGGGGGGTTPTAPTAAFTPTPDASDAATIHFDASASTGDGLSYSWSFGDGETGSGQVTSHKYANGNWTAVLTVTDSHGVSVTKSAEIAISVGGDGGTNNPPDGGTNNPPDGGTTNPPSDGGDTNTTPSPVVAPMCGAGATQMAVASMLGLFALQFLRRRY